MKTALKLNKKQLFELYEKSSALVKENLRNEFGEKFFVPGEVKPEVVRIPKPSKKRSWRIDWEMLFDFTPVLRIALYAFLTSIILLSCTTTKTFTLKDTEGTTYEPVTIKYRHGKAIKAKSASSPKWEVVEKSKNNN